MNYSLQIHNAKYVFPIPDGLKELSSDIIREVLRHQPEHINGFIADYLETMLQVRERARDAGVVVSDVYEEGYFYGELFRLKKVSRNEANFYATVIQAAWRGFVVRRKIKEWLKKKQKFEEEQAQKRELRIEELLVGLGITYEEGKRAAGVIQAAYKESKRGKWMSGELGEFWVAETVPFGERLREGDRALGRYQRWEKEDFGDFFEMTEVGAIKYVWPRVGQMRKVLRDEIPPNIPIVEFYAMRDLDGKEQYSYLIKTQLETDVRGCPIGFLIPKEKSHVDDEYPEVVFTAPQNEVKMGIYTYIFRDDLQRDELPELEEALKSQQSLITNLLEMSGETEQDSNWVGPRVLVRIKKKSLLDTDDEVKFLSLPHSIICEQEEYAFRAETFEQSLKIIRHILRNECLSVSEGLVEAANMKPYKFQEAGRIFPVDKFLYPSYIQKIQITPESATSEEESIDLMLYSYIFLTSDYRGSRQWPKGESTFSISVTRFQGYHSDYRGSAGMDNKVFIMGPRVSTPDGKPFTPESFFWDEFGEEAWHQLLYSGGLEEHEEGSEPGDMRRMSDVLRDDLSKADEQKQIRPSQATFASATTDGFSKYQGTDASTTQTSEEEEGEAEDKPGHFGTEEEGEGKREKLFKVDEGETKSEKREKPIESVSQEAEEKSGKQIKSEEKEEKSEETEGKVKETESKEEDQGNLTDQEK